MNKATKKKIVNYLLGPLLLILTLYLIYRQVMANDSLAEEWNRFAAHWRGANLFLVAIVLVLAPYNWILEARKWQLLLKKIQRIRFGKAFSSILTGITFAMVTPNKLGDFAGRILYLRDRCRLRGAIATLVGNLAQTIVTFTFGVAGLIYFNLVYPGTWQLVLLLLAVAGVITLIYFYLRIDILSRWVERFRGLRSIAVAFRVLRRYSKRDLAVIFWISFVRFCIYNLQFLLLVNILGADIPWVSGFLVSGLMFWMITVFPSFFLADLGVRGFIAGLIFTDTGLADNSIAILAGSYFIWFLNLVVPAIVGSFLLLTVRIIR